MKLDKAGATTEVANIADDEANKNTKDYVAKRKAAYNKLQKSDLEAVKAWRVAEDDGDAANKALPIAKKAMTDAYKDVEALVG